MRTPLDFVSEFLPEDMGASLTEEDDSERTNKEAKPLERVSGDLADFCFADMGSWFFISNLEGEQDGDQDPAESTKRLFQRLRGKKNLSSLSTY